MASEMLEKTRKINKTLQTSGGSNVSFNLLAEALGEVLSSNAYVVSTKGKILGVYLNVEKDSSVIEDEKTHKKMFPEAYSKYIKNKRNKRKLNWDRNDRTSSIRRR